MTYSVSAASSPTAKKRGEFKRAQSAASNTKSKSKVYASARSGTITVNGGASQARGGQATPLPACLEDQRNLEEQLVELEHLRTLNIEVNRERAVTEDVQRDNEMLRKQLARANESI